MSAQQKPYQVVCTRQCQRQNNCKQEQALSTTPLLNMSPCVSNPCAGGWYAWLCKCLYPQRMLDMLGPSCSTMFADITSLCYNSSRKALACGASVLSATCKLHRVAFVCSFRCTDIGNLCIMVWEYGCLNSPVWCISNLHGFRVDVRTASSAQTRACSISGSFPDSHSSRLFKAQCCMQSYCALTKLLPELLRDPEGVAAVRRAVVPVFWKLNLATPGEEGSDPPGAPLPHQQIQQNLNNSSFLKRLALLLRLVPDSLVPPALGETLRQHLQWLQGQVWLPSDSAPVEATKRSYFGAWHLGDEPCVPAAVLELFHLLPAWSVDVLKTTTGPDGKGRNLGLVVLSIELEQVCCASPACIPFAVSLYTHLQA
jgi:hypothetical protein